MQRGPENTKKTIPEPLDKYLNNHHQNAYIKTHHRQDMQHEVHLVANTSSVAIAVSNKISTEKVSISHNTPA